MNRARRPSLAFVFAVLILNTSGSLLVAAEKSGSAWVARYPGGKKVEDVDPAFRPKVEAFFAAARAAGAEVRVTSTLRPRQRAHLMHWSWRIATQGYDARKVPALAGVDIDWWHGTEEKSREAAREMVDGYGTGGLKVAPSLTSRHIEGKAVDARVTREGNLTVKKKDGSTVTIVSTPRDSTNTDLIAVAATYGVVHFSPAEKDRVHWSTDGR